MGKWAQIRADELREEHRRVCGEDTPLSPGAQAEIEGLLARGPAANELATGVLTSLLVYRE
jgi:hypothetical protein